jgi:allantoicase
MQAHMGWDGSTQIRSCCAACEYYLGKTCKHMLVAFHSNRKVHCDKAWWGLFSGPHENRFLAEYPAAGQGPYATLEEAQAASLNNVAASGVTLEPNGQYTVRMGTTLLSSSTGEASWVKLQDWTMDKSLGIPKLLGYRSGCSEYVSANSIDDVVCQCTEHAASAFSPISSGGARVCGCRAGTFSVVGASTCTSCAAGKYSNLTASWSQSMLADILSKYPAYLVATASSWDQSRQEFQDLSGNGRVGRLTSGSASVGSIAGHGADAGVSIPYVGGSASTQILWGSLSVPSTFTICSITRYSGAAKFRILTCTSGNWLHGHWSSNAGATFYGDNIDLYYTITPNTNWVVACGRNVVGSSQVGTIINGVPTSRGKGGTGNCDLTIGGGWIGEVSDWQLSSLYVWNSHLPDDVFAHVSDELNQYRGSGTYSSALGASVCLDCPAGKYLATQGNDAESDCVLCGAGKYSSTPGAATCIECGAGKYLASQGGDEEADCMLCGAGKYSAGAVLTRNPPEASRTYSSVWINSAIGTGFAQSMLDSQLAWSANSNSPGSQWMQIDLGVATRVHGVVIQARHDADQSVTEVEVQHSLDPNWFSSSVQSQANGGVRFFPSATYSNKQKSELIFMEPVVARYIKIVVWGWLWHVSARAGVLIYEPAATGSTVCTNCPAGTYSGAAAFTVCTSCEAGLYSASSSSTVCASCAAGKYSAGAVLTRNPPEASRTYSSVWGNDAIGTGNAQSMLDSQQAWSAASSSPGSQWMQIDLGVATRVHGVVIQARHDVHQYVTEVEVQHSLDPNSGFSSVQSQANGGVRFFPPATYSNKQKSELIFMEPVVARYIKIVVWGWLGHVSARAGVLIYEPAATGSTVCTNCPAGKYSASSSSTVCTSCEAGSYSAAGGSGCTDCAAGKYTRRVVQNKARQCGGVGCPALASSSFGSSPGPEAAVDGNYGPGSPYFHTACAAYQWFRLDLQEVYEINYVRIWNRPDGLQQGRLIQATVRVGMSDTYALNYVCGLLTDAMDQSVWCKGVLGRYVFVVLPDGASCLHFAEIEVYVQQECMDCSAGTYAAAGSTACTSCEAGKYTGAAGSSVCTNCTAGKFSGAVGASVASTCADCGAGTYSAAGASVCTDCAAGKYFGLPAQTGDVCTSCAAGKYSAGAVLTRNPPEASRTYSSVWGNDAIGTGFAQSMLDSQLAWSALLSSPGSQWMQINLGVATRVHGVVIQARHDADQYVTEVEVQHSLDPNSGFSSVQSQANGGVRFFPPATYSNKQKSELIFMEPVVARYIKIVVWGWLGHVSARAGVLIYEPAATGSTVCTNCTAGSYVDTTGSSACSSCAWAWDINVPRRTVFLSSSQSCTCDKGMTGVLSGRELRQDVEEYRPTSAGSIALGNFSVEFNRSRRQFLHAQHRPHLFRIKSGGGLTIAVTARFTDDCSGSASSTGSSSNAFCGGEKILDFGNANDANSVNIALGRYLATSRLVAYITDGGSIVCESVSELKAIEPGKWMAIVLEYNSHSNQLTMRKNGHVIAGPTSCTGVSPSDRNITRMLVGKSNFVGDAFFSGDIRALYVADQILSKLTTVCSAVGTDPGSSCLAQQSSTWTPQAGTQKHRDQGIAGPGGSIGLASKALDSNIDSCSQTWREASPWWRVDLEVPRLVVSVRVYNRIDCCREALEGFEIRVGNWPTWENNPVCASGVAVPPDPRWVEVDCQGDGRFVFIVLPGTGRSLSLCEVEVTGLPNASSAAITGLLPNCTECIAGTYKTVKGSSLCTACEAGTRGTNKARDTNCGPCEWGKYQDESGTTGCKYCPSAWLGQKYAGQKYATNTSGQGATALSNCSCMKGATGRGVGLTSPDVHDRQPLIEWCGRRFGTAQMFSGPHENRSLSGYPAAGRGPYATLEEAQAASLNNVDAGGLVREWNGQYTVRMGTTLLSSSTGEVSWVKLQDWTMCKHAFSFTGARFLEALPRTWNIRSQGGLTIVAEIKFLEAGLNETVIDFGSTLERHYDSFLLSRWQQTDQLYAVITHKVCSCHLRHCLHLIRFPVS